MNSPSLRIFYFMAGRPTDYRDEYNLQSEKLCKLGSTDKELADFFEIAESTLNEWKLKYPEFSESIKKGKELADANVAERLYQRAIGFEHDSEEIKVIPGVRGKVKQNEDDPESEDEDHPNIVRVPIRKIYPPDTVAAIFWLKNRQRDKWRDKQEVDLRTPVGITVNYVKQPGNDPLEESGS